MKCNDIRELMPDLAAGLSAPTPEVKEHLNACTACTDKLAEFQQTMALLDEWQAPEPSPYFDVRLQARLREEQAKPARVWLHWLRPALAASFVLLVTVSIGIIHFHGARNPVANRNVPATVVPGTAVGDLQALDANHDEYSDNDLLDDLEVQQNVTANP